MFLMITWKWPICPIISLLDIYAEVIPKLVPHLDSDKLRKTVSNMYDQNRKLKQLLTKGDFHGHLKDIDQFLNGIATGIES